MDNKIQVTFPVTITLQIGPDNNAATAIATVASGIREDLLMQPSVNTAGSEAEILAKAKKAFDRPDVMDVRLGYVFKGGWITKQRAIVITVKERRSIFELKKTDTALPDHYMGYPIEITNPTIEQLLNLQNGVSFKAAAEALPEAVGKGRYFPPTGIKLEKVKKQKMKVIACVSPERGWEEFKTFLAGTKKSLTIAIYDFGAPHIVKSVQNLARKSTFKNILMTIQPGESVGTGTKENDFTDEEVVTKLKRSFKEKFKVAWVKTGSVNGWVKSSYHIKVTVRDSETTMLCSGNYQSSNEPDLHSDDLKNKSQSFLLRTYNREWNTIIAHKGIAGTLEKFIRHDFKNNQKAERESLFAGMEDLFLLVPKPSMFEAEALVQTFPSFEADREFTVTPLLTPDNYYDVVLKLIKSAKKELYIQNQTFNAPKDGQSKLQGLIDAVLERQQDGVDVKIIFRNLNASSARKNVEDLVDMNFNSSSIKVHPKCHTKGIIVDGKMVMIGSQNWSEDGVSVNRDASFLFEEEVGGDETNNLALYYRKIFLHDWNNIAKFNVGQEALNTTIVNGTESIPPGMERIPLKEVLETL